MRIPAKLAETIRIGIKVQLDKQHSRAEPELVMAKKRVGELEQERERLARGVVTGTIPGDLAREEHEHIDQELDQARRILDTSRLVYEHIEGTLTTALDLFVNVDEVYRLGSPSTRRLTNQCFLTKLLVCTPDDDDSSAEVVSTTFAEPRATLLAEDSRRA